MSDSPNQPNLVVPQNIEELQQIVHDGKQVIAVGNETKKPLSQCPGAIRVSLRAFSGITQYESSEFTFTALAGTPLSEIVEVLSEKNQCLPFDPLLIEAGATIGGTVGSGLSGPGRFRYGGIRDFLLGVNFLSGDGKLIRAGGKVVKNAAGFDIPKFMVGSQGRFGVMTELTFKVFPKPATTTTLRLQCESHKQAIERIAVAAGASWELDAVDYRADEKKIYLRIGGPESSVASIAGQVSDRWGSDVSPAKHAAELWKNVQDLQWSIHRPIVAKIPVTPPSIIPLTKRLPGQLWFSAAGNVLWQSMKDEAQATESSEVLTELDLNGLVVKGETKQCRIGNWQNNTIQNRLKQAFDPASAFADHTEPLRNEGKNM